VELLTLVDAENVRRSEWPNIGKEELVDLVNGWAEATGARAVVVFDGKPPATEPGAAVEVVGTRSESADDWIAREADTLARAGRPYRLVTSDRGLRARAGAGAFDLVGGGTFARTLRAAASGDARNRA
jgi:predicted RNA-binding protein with PIN domain